jgi:hypothetical protein
LLQKKLRQKKGGEIERERERERGYVKRPEAGRYGRCTGPFAMDKILQQAANTSTKYSSKHHEP